MANTPMLIAVSNDTLNFINPNDISADVFKYVCSSKIRECSISPNHDHLLIIEEKNVPLLICIREQDNIAVDNCVIAIPEVTAGKYRRKRNNALVLGSGMGVAVAYDLTTNKVCQLVSVPGPVVSLDLNCADDKVVVACKKGIFVVLELESLATLFKCEIDQEICSLGFYPTLPDSFLVHTGNILYTFDAGKKERKLTRDFPELIKSLTFIGETETLMMVCYESRISAYDSAEDSLLAHHLILGNILSLAGEKGSFAVGTLEGEIFIFDYVHNGLIGRKVNSIGSEVNLIYFYYPHGKFTEEPEASNPEPLPMSQRNLVQLDDLPNFSDIINEYREYFPLREGTLPLATAKQPDFFKALRDKVYPKRCSYSMLNSFEQELEIVFSGICSEVEADNRAVERRAEADRALNELLDMNRENRANLDRFQQQLMEMKAESPQDYVPDPNHEDVRDDLERELEGLIQQIYDDIDDAESDSDF